ncbi:dihydrolipoyllysine-residue acetyltransferase component of pyruvate dehydrogenase complex [Alicyclobacillus contaminans]|nr:dihydrolipoyllysine-residue acetyltransferase component of pyruvate dehydrogenase complex [Alicyclobacillus contaminans]
MSTVEFRLPDVGEGIQEAEIVKWLVQEGERIQEFDPLVEVQTDKALVELPAPTTGYIEEIVAVTGSIVRVGDVLVRIGSQKPASAAASGNGSADDVTSALHLAVKQVSKAGNALRLKATPGVRHYARALGVPLTALQGTGPGGRITKQDVDHYLHTWRPTVRPVDTRSWADDGGDSLLWSAVKQAEVQRTERTQEARAASEEVAPRVRSGVRIPFRGVRRATAEHVKRSFFSAPHVTAFDDCDATELVNLRARWNKELEAEGKHVTYLPFLVKATVSALKAFPFFNACLDEAAQEIELISEYHIGIAVDSADGLFVPVIRNADQLSIREIADEIARLTEGSGCARSVRTNCAAARSPSPTWEPSAACL